MDVAIFGAGIAGLMTAITLQAQGYRCRVYERSRQSQEAGNGFILLRDVLDCLDKFGIHLAGAPSAVPLHLYCHRNTAGQVLHKQEMPFGALSIRRHDLVGWLVRALPAGAAPVFEAELDRLEFDKNGRVTAACLVSGEHIRADLYVAADGVHSRARQALFPGWPAPLARVLEVAGVTHCQAVAGWAAENFNKLHAPEGGIALGILPVNNDDVIWFLQFDAKRFPPPGAGGADRLAFARELAGSWANPVPDLLAMTDFARAYVWRPIDADLIPRFYRENLVLVGDAAHPLLPFTSQGVSSAIADAVALANAVEAEDDLARSLARYSNERREQCAPYIAKGRELMQRFLAPQAARDVSLPIA